MRAAAAACKTRWDLIAHPLGSLGLLEQQVLTDLSGLLPEMEPGTYWLDITGCGFAQAAGIGEDVLYLCMYRNGSGLVRATDIVNYLLGE